MSGISSGIIESWHVHPETGDTSRCRAKKREDCKFIKNGLQAVHGMSEEGARRAYEKTMNGKTFVQLPPKKNLNLAIVNLHPTIRSELGDLMSSEDFYVVTKHSKDNPDYPKTKNEEREKDGQIAAWHRLVSKQYDKIWEEMAEIGIEDLKRKDSSIELVKGGGGFYNRKEYYHNRVHENIVAPEIMSRMETMIGKEIPLQIGAQNMFEDYSDGEDYERRYARVERDVKYAALKDDKIAKYTVEPNGFDTFPDGVLLSSIGSNERFIEVKSAKYKGESKILLPSGSLGSYIDFHNRIKNRDLAFFRTIYVVVGVQDSPDNKSFEMKKIRSGRIWDFTSGHDKDDGKITCNEQGNPNDFIRNVVKDKGDREWLVTALKKEGLLPRDFVLSELPANPTKNKNTKSKKSTS